LRRRRRRRCPCDCPGPLAEAGPSSDWGWVDSVVMRVLPGTVLSGALCFKLQPFSQRLLSFPCLSPVQLWTGNTTTGRPVPKERQANCPGAILRTQSTTIPSSPAALFTGTLNELPPLARPFVKPCIGPNVGPSVGIETAWLALSSGNAFPIRVSAASAP